MNPHIEEILHSEQDSTQQTEDFVQKLQVNALACEIDFTSALLPQPKKVHLRRKKDCISTISSTKTGRLVRNN
jgi:hypothetical protein